MRPVALLHFMGSLGGALFAATCLFATVAAVDIPVTTPTDLIDLNGDCSLREAIEAANTDTVVDACPAGSGADVILIPTGTITLSISPVLTNSNATGDLDLFTEMTLQGVDARTTVIDGAGLDRILHISTTASVTVADLTLTNGHAPDGIPYNEYENPPGSGGHGGAVLNEGTLWMQRVTVRASRAGNGGRMGGSAPPWPPASAGKGGGIYNRGVLNIVQSAVIGNRAGFSGEVHAPHFVQAASGGDGGGVYNTGTLAIHTSTIADNRAPDGESVSNLFYYNVVPGDGGSGGGIAGEGSVTLDNVTVIANTAGYGGIGTNGIYTRTGESGVGGGIHYSATVGLAVHNTVLAGNRAASTASDCAGNLESLGFNLIQAADGCTISGSVSSNIYGVDSQLGPLGVYRGPTPVYFAPYTGPAVDRGDCVDSNGVTVIIDQEGTARPQLGGCDIGASEAYAPDHLQLLPYVSEGVTGRQSAVENAR